MPVVWVLRGAPDADVVVPAEFVSICNNKEPFGLANVTDRDRRLAAAKRSQSVTSSGQNSTQLLQIETFGPHGWSIAVLASLSSHPPFLC